MNGEVKSEPSSELWPTITLTEESKCPSNRLTPGRERTYVESTTGPKKKPPYGELPTMRALISCCIADSKFFRSRTEVMLMFEMADALVLGEDRFRNNDI